MHPVRAEKKKNWAHDVWTIKWSCNNARKRRKITQRCRNSVKWKKNEVKKEDYGGHEKRCFRLVATYKKRQKKIQILPNLIFALWILISGVQRCVRKSRSELHCYPLSVNVEGFFEPGLSVDWRNTTVGGKFWSKAVQFFAKRDILLTLSRG